MKLILPYGIKLGADGKIETVPIAHIRVRTGSGTKEVPGIFIIDSGATTSLLPITDAEALGINIKSGERISIRGISGRELIGYKHTIIMIIENFQIKSVPVIFAMQRSAPRILGRGGIFDKFGIMFDEPKRRTALLDSHKNRKIIDSVFDTK